MNESVANASEPFVRLGRYEVLLPVADDGFVTTAIARVRGPGAGPRMVELARVAGGLSREAEIRAAFLAEARSAGRIRHVNFVQPTDTLVHEGDLFAATEFVLGVRLEELMQASRHSGTDIPVGVTARIVLDVLAGLSAVHAMSLANTLARPLVHGDVAPSNIVISYRGVARLIHSGLAVAASRIGAIDRRNPRLAYKAPEQLRAGVLAVPIGPGADLFAVGVILWEMLTKERLFDAGSDLETVERVLHAPLPTSAALSSKHVPSGLAELVCLALDRRSARPTTSAADFAEALEQAAGPGPATDEEVALFVDQLLGPRIDAVRETLHARVREADQKASEQSGVADFHEVPAPSAIARTQPPPSSRRTNRALVSDTADVPPPPSSGKLGPGRQSASADHLPSSASHLPSERPQRAQKGELGPLAGEGSTSPEPMISSRHPRVEQPRRRVGHSRRLSRMPPPRPRIGVYLALGALVGLLAAASWRVAQRYWPTTAVVSPAPKTLDPEPIPSGSLH